MFFKFVTGWPSGLRRVTQAKACRQSRFLIAKAAWVRIPLLSLHFCPSFKIPPSRTFYVSLEAPEEIHHDAYFQSRLSHIRVYERRSARHTRAVPHARRCYVVTARSSLEPLPLAFEHRHGSLMAFARGLNRHGRRPAISLRRPSVFHRTQKVRPAGCLRRLPLLTSH